MTRLHVQIQQYDQYGRAPDFSMRFMAPAHLVRCRWAGGKSVMPFRGSCWIFLICKPLQSKDFPKCSTTFVGEILRAFPEIDGPQNHLSDRTRPFWEILWVCWVCWSVGPFTVVHGHAGREVACTDHTRKTCWIYLHLWIGVPNTGEFVNSATKGDWLWKWTHADQFVGRSNSRNVRRISIRTRSPFVFDLLTMSWLWNLGPQQTRWDVPRWLVD